MIGYNDSNNKFYCNKQISNASHISVDELNPLQGFPHFFATEKRKAL